MPSGRCATLSRSLFTAACQMRSSSTQSRIRCIQNMLALLCPAVRISIVFLGERGTISHQAIDDAARSRSNLRLVSLENTHNRSGGSVWPLDLLNETCRAAHEHRLAVHLDGTGYRTLARRPTLISQRAAGTPIRSGSICQRASAAQVVPCWQEVANS